MAACSGGHLQPAQLVNSQNVFSRDQNPEMTYENDNMDISAAYVPSNSSDNVENSQHGDFSAMFTSAVSTALTLNNTDIGDIYDLSYTSAIDIPQSTQSNKECSIILQQDDIQKLDSELIHVPMEIYVEKLLELTSHNPNHILWYRNILLSRANSVEGCPKGSLTSRKTTKNNSNSEKYAKDCYVLQSFINGERGNIEEIFDKSKPKSVTETPKVRVSMVDIRSSIQTLLQRVSDLETIKTQNEKTIKSLTHDVHCLQDEITSLKNEFDKFKSEIVPKVAKCENLQKITATQMKCLEGLDSNAYESCKIRTNDEIKRLSKVTSNLQKQVSDIQVFKSYASITSPLSTQADQTVTPRKDQETLGMTTKVSPLLNAGNNIGVVTVASKPADIVNVSDLECSVDASTSDENKHRENDPNSKQSQKHFKSNLNGQSKQNDFVGVTYKRNARYYLSGIGPQSTREGILNYLEGEGVRVSHLVLFKSKSKNGALSAKVNVAPDDAEIVETPGFWPRRVRCRRWYNVRDWQALCARRNQMSDDDNDGYRDDFSDS